MILYTLLLAAICLASFRVTAFIMTGRTAVTVTQHRIIRHHQQAKTSIVLTRRSMGLYDEPLPPRPPPRNVPLDVKSDEDDDEDDDDFDDDDDDVKVRLFQFNKRNGAEVNNLLPPLGRSLTSNIPCYFEPTDRKVINLVGKTSCHVEDACWALEACKGDVTEAWTRISVARRMQLIEQDSNTNNNQSYGEMDRDVYELELEEDYAEQKEALRMKINEKDRADFFKGGEPDQNIWPNFNVPDENEPWFTG